LLQNLLEWSQMVRGNTTFIPQNLVLKDIITECLSLATESAREKSISLIMEISDELQVFADSNMLQTIIRNLLSNSIKFTRNGGRVSIAAEAAENNMIVISVKDTGIGMNNEMVENIFRIDVNTKRTGTNKEASTGLGLLLCKEFVEKHGGEIVVKSIENQGSEFFLLFPAP
jgi:signal transduction histidine kinase